MREEIKKTIQMLRKGQVPDGFKNTEIGIIPFDWKIESLSKYITNFSNGISIEGSNRPANEFEVGILKTSSVTSNGFKPSENKVILKDEDKKKLKINPQKGNLIVIRKNTPDLVGLVSYVDKDYHNLFLPDLLWQTELSDVEIDTKWLYYFLNTRYYKKIIKTLATGTSNSMPNISKTNYLKIKVFGPGLLEQTRISKIITTWDKAIELREKLIELKREQKKGIMQKYLTGKAKLPGFGGEWGYEKLKDILEVRKEKSQITSVLDLYSLTIEDGVTPKTDRYNREFLVKSDNKEYKITKQYDIVYNPANLRFGAIALNMIEKPVLLSPIYEILYLKDTKKFDIKFISQLLTWDRQIKIFATKAEGTLVERMAVKIESFLNMQICVPLKIEEQKAIATLLDLYDKEVNLIKAELKALRRQKVGLMQLLLSGTVRVN